MAERLIEALVPPWVRALVPYQPGKPIEEVEREYGISDSVKLASNENPLGPSPKAVAALRAVAPEVHRYPDGSAYRLRHRLAAELSVPPETIVFGNGSNELLDLVGRLVLRPGDEVVFSSQAFVVYESVARSLGAEPRDVPLRNYVHDLEAIADRVSERTRLVFLGNPNNPTGTIFRRAELERFLGRVPPSVVVVVDEAYFEYVEDPEYPNSLAYHGSRELLVTTRTFSKIHGLAGLRIGYAVCSAEMADLLHRLRAPFNANSAAQAAAIAALDDRDHVERSRAVNAEGKRWLLPELERLGCEVVPSEANFLLVRVGDGAAVSEGLLRRGVIVRPMGAYAFPEFVRVTIGTAPENERFVAALRSELRA